MEHHAIPKCSWMGVNDDEGTEFPCGRPATGYAETRTGHRIYSCEEHIASAKSRAGTGRYVHGFRLDDELPPIVQHAAVSPA